MQTENYSPLVVH